MFISSQNGKQHAEIYPLVNQHKYGESMRITIFHGKTHQFYGHVQVRKLLVITRGHWVNSWEVSYHGSSGDPKQRSLQLALEDWLEVPNRCHHVMRSATLDYKVQEALRTGAKRRPSLVWILKPLNSLAFKPLSWSFRAAFAKFGYTLWWFVV